MPDDRRVLGGETMVPNREPSPRPSQDRSADETGQTQSACLSSTRNVLGLVFGEADAEQPIPSAAQSIRAALAELPSR